MCFVDTLLIFGTMEKSDRENIKYNNRRLAMQWVVNSKQLILNPWNHAGALRDKNFMVSLAFFMSDQEDEVIKMALEIGHLLLQNPKNLPALLSDDVFSMGYKLANHMYKNSKKHRHFASLINDVLTKLKYPDREMRERTGLRLEEQQDKAIWGDTTVHFHMPGLTPDNRDCVCRVVAQVPSVVSCSVDLTRCRLTLTVRSAFSPSLVKMTVAARLLLDISTLDPMNTTFVQASEDGTAAEGEGGLPPYWPEVDSPVKKSALAKIVAENIRDKANGIVGWFQKSFYW